MSNHLSVAMVTAVISRLLSESLAAAGPGGVENATVTTLRPGTLAAAADDTTHGINVYLYRVVPNASWAASTLPTRRADGTLVDHPRQAVDLHYLLTFSGDDSALEPQRLLGLAVTTLAARPVLGRELVRYVVQQAAQTDKAGWQQYADLDQQPDVVRTSLLPLDVEEMSKLWSMLFHSPYRLSLAYQATVVLLDAQEPPAAPAPAVVTRVVTVQPSTAVPAGGGG
ncbi:DUF4255 domain-containing protein [Streptomyces sp. NPDC090088]|uniref:DUF4255 domain-containing protein n=1 Tax=Streptomyces sp. NPDC090088 TaxID=3365944 RepID=UPI0037F66920